MYANTDIYLTRGDTGQHALTASVTVHHEHESNNIALDEDLIPVPPTSDASRLLSSLATGDGEACVGESMIHPIKPDQEHSDIQPAGNKFDYEHSRSFPQSDPDQVVLPAVPEEGFLLELPIVPACGSPPAIDINNTEVVVCSQVPQVSCPKAITETVRHDGRGDAHLVDPLTCTPILHAESDRINSAGLIHLTDEETQDIDYAHKNFPSSLPPSSSPPQLFSSSPCVSSQSSAGEPPETTLVFEANGPVDSFDCPHLDHLVLVTQEESRLESEHYTATAPTAERSYSESHPTSCVKSSSLSKKRTASQRDAGESYGSQPNKHPKQGSNRYRPPTPMRATLASQNRQFKKLAAPFRPPSKLPVARDRPVQAMTDRTIESIGCSRSEVGDKCSDQREPVTHVSSLHNKNKGANTSRSATQFKSPLVNRVSDSRTTRLTPAVQALERKLQLLKRAIKVKEDNEEEVLVRLARKWTEAGREVVYDIWDATKDIGDFEGRTTLVHGSYGWKNADDRNVPWSWETKLGDVGKESCDRDTPTTPEEDDEVGFNNTVGNMLRQIGIAPEIFGWDDDKETFCD